MKDYIVRATAANGQVRAFAAITREIVEEARQHHGTSPVATAALGRLLTAGTMMGSNVHLRKIFYDKVRKKRRAVFTEQDQDTEKIPGEQEKKKEVT